MELHLKIIGAILILLAVIHLAFPKRFNWKTEFATLSLINRQVMYVHTFFIALVIFGIGVLCISSAQELIETKLGGKIAFGLFIFWFIRWLFQFFVYSTKLWRGKRFETYVHILFIFLWTYISIIFFLVYWYNPAV